MKKIDLKNIPLLNWRDFHELSSLNDGSFCLFLIATLDSYIQEINKLQDDDELTTVSLVDTFKRYKETIKIDSVLLLSKYDENTIIRNQAIAYTIINNVTLILQSIIHK